MNVSETFLGFVRRLIGAFFVLLLIAALGHAQNAGNVGIYTREVTVFTNQSATAHSAIFPDFGFAANYLTYCTTGFNGSIDLEWSPNPGVVAYIPLAIASFTINADTNCRTLQAGGYFPNLRSTATVTIGSISAYYTASSAPISFVAAGLGSNGPASPIVCDHNIASTLASGGTANFLSPILPGDSLVICGFTLSFASAPSTGNVQIGWAASSCASPTINWEVLTTASSPQVIPTQISVRSPSSNVVPLACLVNNSGANIILSASYASVHGL